MAEIGADVSHVIRFAVDLLDGLGGDQTDTASPSRSLRTSSHHGPLRGGSSGSDVSAGEEECGEQGVSEGGSRPSSAAATPHHVRSPRSTANAPNPAPTGGGGGGGGLPGKVRRARGPVVVAAAAQAVAASEGKMSELSGTSARLEESDTHTHSATHAIAIVDRDVGDAYSSSSLTQSRLGGWTSSSYVSLAATSESDGAAGRRRVTGDPVSALLLHQATV
jgi:hypothetical protein